MKRTLLVLGMVLALAMTAMANVEPTSMDAEITSPTAGELIYENALSLAAVDPSVAESTEDLDWAVVTDDGMGTECTGEIHFNRNNSAYDYEAGVFGAELDISGLEAGEYCFVFNTFNRNNPEGVRLVQWFYIVDEYAKVGGVLQADAIRVGNGTHAIEGVIGLAGTEAVGSIDVNYRALGEVCTFTPRQDLSIGDTAPGIGEDDSVRANGTFDNSCGGTAGVWILGRGGVLEAYSERGAFSILGAGNYTIELNLADNTPLSNWVPMSRGNNHVGTR